MPRLELVETALRCGQQMLLVSRLRRRHLIPVLELLDGAGFAAIDVFGGSTFEACLRFLGEDPFERLAAARAAAPNTPLLATLRGQALVSHRQVADDVVDAFVAAAAEHGLDIFRFHDALNDVRNLERCCAAVHAVGKRAEGAIVYAESPAHSVAGFVDLGGRLAEIGYDQLCVYDPVGLLGAGVASELVAVLSERTGLPVGVHCASLTGQAGMAYHAATLAGAASVDVALTPLAAGASTPATEGVLHALRGTDRDPGLDPGAVSQASRLLEQELHLYRDIIDHAASRPEAAVLRDHLHPVAMAHLVQALRERDRLDALGEVEEEVVRIRAELGWPPLVTPIGEIVATQAVYNVCDGDRYATISEEVKDYCLGLYGAPPVPVQGDVMRAVNGREEPITCRPADLLQPAMDAARRELERDGIKISEASNVVTYALFPDEYRAFARGEVTAEVLGDEAPQPTAESAPPAVLGVDTVVQTSSPSPPADDVRELTVEVDGMSYAVRVIAPAGTFGGGAGGAASAGSNNGVPSVSASVVREGTVVAPMQGLILRVPVSVGQQVQLGEVVCVLEAMKMQNDITATRAGRVTEVYVTEGVVVSPRDALVQIG